MHKIIVVGIALFSMFFGGGNLTFPLWLGSTSGSILYTVAGFLLTGVLLPFLGVFISLKYAGESEKILGALGKKFGHILTFLLLLFWIPLGSAPRCIQLSYGAFRQMNLEFPLWSYSLIYSIILFFLTHQRAKILDILGRFLTPVLITSLVGLIALGVNDMNLSNINFISPDPFSFLIAFRSGYYTQDFIAAIFFTSTIIKLIQLGDQENFKLKNVYISCLIAISMLSIIYIGMIFIGDGNSDKLGFIPREELLAALGTTFVHPKFHFVIFLVITLSCLTTSAALSLVFADFIYQKIFVNKISYKTGLCLSLLISFALSLIGFEALAVIIDIAMGVLYPVLLAVALYALYKKIREKKRLAID